MQPHPQGLIAFQYGGGKREDPGTQRTKTIADWCIPWCVHTCALIGLLLPKQRWRPFEGFEETDKCFLQCLRPKMWAEFRSNCWKTVTVPLEGKDSKIVGRFNSCFHRCSACVLRYTRSSFGQSSCFIHLQMRISEMIIAGIY